MHKQPSYSEVIVPLFRSLRSEIMAAYGAIEHELKDNLTVVTEIDRMVEQRIIDALSEEFPDIGFNGEEHGKHGNSDTYWLIDPIDGTESYIRGLPGVMSMIGLVENGECTQSYIYDPVHDVMYSAYKGGGAFADDEPLRVAERPLERSLIAVGSKMIYEELETVLALKNAGVYHVSQYFGAGAKGVYLATGKIDGIVYYNQGGGPWDHLPPKLLAIEAGARYTDYGNPDPERHNYTLLAPTVYEQLTKVTDRLWKK